jgi:guanylate kinase
MPPTTKFLLLLGPSGVGKSRIIWVLREMDRRYVYISPFTNRRLRDGETDKVYVDDAKMDRMAAAGEFLIVNELFGYRYATPRRTILDALATGQFPLLDWPVDRLSVMQEAFEDKLFVVYVEPPSLEVLAERLKADGRDGDGGRFRAATDELEHYWAGESDGICDLKVTSVEGQVPQLAATIHDAYLRSLG